MGSPLIASVIAGLMAGTRAGALTALEELVID